MQHHYCTFSITLTEPALLTEELEDYIKEFAKLNNLSFEEIEGEKERMIELKAEVNNIWGGRLEELVLKDKKISNELQLQRYRPGLQKSNYFLIVWHS